ncbi:MAG: hypothetical protein AW07_04168 [Candidatus Accumulibacter sp. SK-11]|nr:MAG: hypothetical protein AW07_04168 [Candidatus Accumulibacter sp. SK-11]
MAAPLTSMFDQLTLRSASGTRASVLAYWLRISLNRSTRAMSP